MYRPTAEVASRQRFHSYYYFFSRRQKFRDRAPIAQDPAAVGCWWVSIRFDVFFFSQQQQQQCIYHIIYSIFIILLLFAISSWTPSPPTSQKKRTRGRRNPIGIARIKNTFCGGGCVQYHQRIYYNFKHEQYIRVILLSWTARVSPREIIKT